MIEELKKIASYIVIGNEVAPSTGTRHWQGYVELEDQLAITTINKMAGWHTEARKSKDPIKAAEYCKKEGDIVIEYGRMKCPGKRTDIDRLRELGKAEGLGSVAAEATSMQQYRLVEVFLNFHAPARDPNIDPTVTWITGASGSGKSRLAFDMLKSKKYYVKDAGEWWTGYNGEEYVLMDDFRDSWMTHNMFIKILDRYPMKVRIHGGLTQLRATHWIVTSVLRPETLYTHCPDEPRAQIIRRITNIIHLPTAAGPGATHGEADDVYSEVGVIVDPTYEFQNVGQKIDEM